MAQVLTDQDINNPNQQNKNPNQVQTNQSDNQQDSNAQIAQNYSGASIPQQNMQQGNQPAYNPNVQKGSGFTNIQRIVQANQGNRLGSTIGQNIQNAGQAAQQSVGNAQQQFNQQAGANRADTSANANLVQQALANPNQFAGTPGQVSQFQNLMSGSYQGPQGLQNAGQLQAQAQDVAQLGKSINTPGGQQGLLQRFVGSPQYTAGQQSLDSLLLGATGGNALAQARRATTGIENKEQQAQQGAAQTAQEYAKRAQQFGQGVQQQFGQNVANQQQALTQQAQTAQQARDAQVAALQQQLGTGDISSDMAQQLGIQSGQRMLNVDPSKFLAENALQANAQNIASAQDYAKMQALQKLGGQFAPQQAQQTLAQFQNPNKAGTFQASNAYNLNAPAFQQAYGAAQKAYQTGLDPFQQKQAEAQKIVDVYKKYGLTDPSTAYQMQGGAFSKALNPNAPDYNTASAAARGEIAQFAPGALGGGMEVDWALQNALKSMNALNAQQALEDKEFGTKEFKVGNKT